MALPSLCGVMPRLDVCRPFSMSLSVEEERRRLGYADGRQFAELHRAAVSGDFDLDMFDQRGTGPAGAHAAKLLL
jgi:hypothetical protein